MFTVSISPGSFCLNFWHVFINSSIFTFKSTLYFTIRYPSNFTTATWTFCVVRNRLHGYKWYCSHWVIESKKSYLNVLVDFHISFQALTKSSRIVAFSHNNTHFKKVDNLSWMLIIVSIVFTICQVWFIEFLLILLNKSETFCRNDQVFFVIFVRNRSSGFKNLWISLLWPIWGDQAFSPVFNYIDIFGIFAGTGVDLFSN